MTKKVKFLSFCLLLTLGTAAVVFNSCSKDDNSKKEETDPDKPSGPDTSTTDPGVVINGIRWATRNVDKPGIFAAKPENAGMFYQWNSKIGWSSANPMINTNDGTVWISSWNGNDASSWEKSNNPCPAGWRMPTRQELQKLYDAGSVWTDVNKVNGRLFGSGENTIFLPAVGCRYYNDGALGNAGSGGYYWSSTRDDNGYACYLGFDNGAYMLASNYWTMGNGISCRCVAE